ncbi:hypothetical protein, partial [Alteromonas sp.]|uniref:hypothetical protein n=1 Tax=Alteromonas sp. TaxID=232 RepID=UPI00257D95EA
VRERRREDAQQVLFLAVIKVILATNEFLTRFDTLFMHEGWLLRQMFYIISKFSIRIFITRCPHRAGRNGSCK